LAEESSTGTPPAAGFNRRRRLTGENEKETMPIDAKTQPEKAAQPRRAAQGLELRLLGPGPARERATLALHLAVTNRLRLEAYSSEEG
jgi:hypothetical protein